MSKIFDYIGNVESKAVKDLEKNRETFKAEFGPYKVTDKTKDITKCFHPEGKTGYQGMWAMAGWRNAVQKNVNAFKPLSKTAAISPEQFDIGKHRGGMIVFSPRVNAVKLNKEDEQENKKQQDFLSDWQSSFAEGLTSDLVADYVEKYAKYYQGYTFGKGFAGHYVSQSGKIFDEESLTLEIIGISSQDLIELAETLAWAFFQETVLVKDYNNGKVYLVDGRVSDKPEDYDPNLHPALKDQGKPLTEEELAERKETAEHFPERQEKKNKAREIIREKIDKGELPADTDPDEYYIEHPEVLNESSNDEETK